ncbi:hypothetical protein TWF696_007563 [Orbilia brochopaga]|uniref:Uncharacterized protein n=1 Tax=Orbilia brochopaga TaxID=3140254 RepID=A0AAV9ULC2_9PEZI
MPHHLTVLSHLFPREGVQLGRLVTNPAAPHNQYCPQATIRYLKHDVHSVTGKEFLDIRNKTTNSKLQLIIEAIVKILAGKDSDIQTRIADTVCITYLLDNSERKFKNLCASKEAKTFLETAYKKRKKVYMVTGIQTVTEASLWAEVKSESEVTGSATTGPAAAAGYAPDIRAVASHLEKKHRESGFIAEKEQIYAIQYRKIKFGLKNFFRGSPEIQETELEDGYRWEVMWNTMGPASEEACVIEVSLEPDVELEIHEKGLESCDVGEDVVFIPETV